MLKKCFSILITIILILGMCLNVNATELKTKLDVIEQASEIKYLENDQGYISKTIVDSNEETGEITIELKLSNTAKEVEEIKETEIFLVVDNSGSMGYTTSTGEVRRDMIVRSLKSLVNYIYDNSANVKVGLVRFAREGELLTNGTALMSELTNDKQTMLNAINEYENLNTSVDLGDGQIMEHCESGTNIEAGLKRANDNFSSDCQNKILVLLTDGIPNASINYSSESYIYNATKTRLQSIGESGVTVISMMTGVTEDDDNDAQQIVEQIFGTETNPTTGKFYNIADANLETIVTENILADIMEKVQQPINTVKIVDYFPEDITENFEFSYVENPSVGTVSETIDEETKTITWNIDTLRGDEVATLKYKLKIKDMKNTGLLEKTIATNEKVVLTYKDTETKDYTVELTSSPKIKLTEVKEELTATVSYDPTEETTESVTATIKTNKKVNAVEGWTLSEDGMTLTKVYKTNATETVHLVDLDGMTKDVEVKIGNIIKEQPKNEIENEPDNTLADKELPNTGKNIIVIVSIITIITALVVIYKKQSEYKDIK